MYKMGAHMGAIWPIRLNNSCSSARRGVSIIRLPESVLPVGDLGPHLTHGSLVLRSTRICPPNGISIVSTVFAQFTDVLDSRTHTETDGARSAAVGGIYAASAGDAA